MKRYDAKARSYVSDQAKEQADRRNKHKGDEKVNCPMTQKNVEKYNLTEKEEKSFCNKGCSVICKEEFEKYIQKKEKKQ